MGIQCFSVYFIKHTHFKPKGNRNTKTLVTIIWGTFKTKRDLFEAEYMIIPALFIQSSDSNVTAIYIYWSSLTKHTYNILKDYETLMQHRSQFEFCEKPTTAYIMVARGVASVQ